MFKLVKTAPLPWTDIKSPISEVQMNESPSNLMFAAYTSIPMSFNTALSLLIVMALLRVSLLPVPMNSPWKVKLPVTVDFRFPFASKKSLRFALVTIWESSESFEEPSFSFESSIMASSSPIASLPSSIVSTSVDKSSIAMSPLASKFIESKSAESSTVTSSAALAAPNVRIANKIRLMITILLIFNRSPMNFNTYSINWEKYFKIKLDFLKKWFF